MYCHKCGSAVPEGVRYCHKCGAQLHALSYTRSETPLPSATSAVRVPAAEKTAVRKRKPLFTVTVCVAALILLAVVIHVTGLGASIQEKTDSVYYLEVYDSRGDILGSGSGFVWKDRTTLVTNYHVIKGASKIIAVSPDEREEVTITSAAAYSWNSDLAILISPTALNAKPLSSANSDRVKQGDRIYAIGYPLGLSNTLSDGIVSSRFYDEYDVDTLQITAAISPGSSGGPLLNRHGRVIGVVCAYYVDGQNMNLAIASNTLETLYTNRKSPVSLSSIR